MILITVNLRVLDEDGKMSWLVCRKIFKDGETLREVDAWAIEKSLQANGAIESVQLDEVET